eukprot:TRINITY_DN1375_c0_g1_i2.p1 TRINITY_DN1375_c0_g1~~TRINITY_DN1375_c0_g1_i2.p1  ORF type:complete len:381 (+),score=111.26 TRINITY_DN1375_c0_g1_i2:182-1324(+)
MRVVTSQPAGNIVERDREVLTLSRDQSTGSLKASMEEKINHFPFEYLSVELQDMIFANLELPELITMRSTSKRFYEWMHNGYVDLVLDTNKFERYPTAAKTEVEVLSRIAECWRSMYKPSSYLSYAAIGCQGTISKATIGLMPTCLREFNLLSARMDPQITSVPFVNLESLILEEVTIVKFEWISQLSSLKGVTMKRCNISSASLRHLPPTLLYLHLDDVYSVVSLGSIPARLEALKIEFNNVDRHFHFSCAGLERCQQLRSLTMNLAGEFCSIDDIDLIAQLDSLSCLKLCFDDVLPMHFSELFKCPRNLNELRLQISYGPRLSHEFLTNAMAPSLSEVTLFLNKNEETKQAVEHLRKVYPQIMFNDIDALRRTTSTFV